ncbi:MAG: type II toxin-antitoxin system VapC family toxin [Lentimonas sp.]
MISHILDSTVYAERLRQNPLQSVVERWSELGNASLAISPICEAEVLCFLEKKASTRLWTEYKLYLKNQLVVLPLDHTVLEAYARIKAETSSATQEIGEFDLLIAATALTHNLRVATLKPKEFEEVPGLVIENWN